MGAARPLPASPSVALLLKSFAKFAVLSNQRRLHDSFNFNEHKYVSRLNACAFPFLIISIPSKKSPCSASETLRYETLKYDLGNFSSNVLHSWARDTKCFLSFTT